MTDCDRVDPPPASLGTCSLLDACTAINLFASRRMPEILRAEASPVGIVEAVYREAVYVYGGGNCDDAREREAVDLGPVIQNGLLRVNSPTDEELIAFLT